MRLEMLLILLLGTGLLAAEGDENPTAETKKVEEGDENSLLTSTRLRGKVRNMRKQVLGGGPAVVKSEKEALKFYRGKIQEMASRSDDLRTQRDSKDAEYRVALDTTLKSEDPGERGEAAREAQRLKAEIRGLDNEIAAMEKRGESIGRGVESIQRRISKRERLVSQFERNDIVDDMPYFADDVLGDDEGAGASGNPFADEDFINDMLKQDPEAARRLLFDADPVAYFDRFPLKPITRSLKKALPFPPADLPGSR
ncbi:MAG: hypothetical protein ACYTEG_12285 [Planctomycetota bacterium]|jgi:prefoldin subunit 5